MGDQGELWRDVKSVSADKRAANREGSAATLDRLGIAYVAKNAGARLVVTHAGVTIDFWPGKGKWIPRAPAPHQGKDRRGVARLIGYLRALEREVSGG